MKITWSKHAEDWSKLCYDFVKIDVTLVILGPIVTQKPFRLDFFTIGCVSSLALFWLGLYFKEKRKE